MNKHTAVFATCALFLFAGSNTANATEPVIFGNGSEQLNMEINQILQSKQPVATISEQDKKQIDDFIAKTLNEANEKHKKEILANEVKPSTVSLAKNVQIQDTELINYAKSLLGVPYVYGGVTTNGFDCSGFVKYVFEKYGVVLPRTTFEQVKKGTSINLAEIKPNDLVFFDTRSSFSISKDTDDETDRSTDGKSQTKNSENSLTFEDIKIDKTDKIKLVSAKPSSATHVGLYIGDGKFIHASTYNKKIVIEDLNSSYFKNRVLAIKRYI